MPSVLRFKYDVDLLAGMEKMVKQEKIRNAVVLSGAGSVRGYHIHQVSNREFPSKNMFVKNPTEPADLILLCSGRPILLEIIPAGPSP